jgi:hypothetical protein
VPGRRTVALDTSVFTLGVTAKTYWAIFEWATGARYTITHTVIDSIVDSIGVPVAALVAPGTNPASKWH